MKLLLGALFTAVFLPAAGQAASEPKLLSKYTRLTGCKLIAQGDVERGEDWGSLRCNGLGGIPAWYRCQDSARCKYGFGVRSNVSGTFGTGREGLLEWRGVRRNGRFEPVAVIIRLPSADSEATPPNSLIVYRLRADGTSCIVGETFSHEEARKIADGSVGSFRCDSEPESP